MSRAALLSLLADPHVGVREAVRRELLLRPPSEGPDLARDILALRDPKARAEGVRAVVARKEDATPFALDPDAEVRARALATGRVARPQLETALKLRDARTRALALECLNEPALAAPFVSDPAEELRIACARVTDDRAVLERLARDRSWRVRLAVVLAAERRRQKDDLPVLMRVLKDPPGRVRARAAAALEGLTGLPFGDDLARWEKWWGSGGRTFELPPPRAQAPSGAGHSSARVTFRSIPVASRRCCFILDASRSMVEPAPGKGGKTRWDLVVEDLRAVVERLPDDARFNVVLFRTDVASWKPRLVPVTSGTRRACSDWIGDEKPAGWTNLYDALALALSDDDVDAVYVLTDGVPSRGAETDRLGILGELSYLNRYRLVQVNCIQAGSKEGLGKRWEGFLDDLAAANDGIAVRE
ncbi:MAG TPA: HEAT repeat domain-containing protein [Planctomycetota bacterium]|nr:HEAT repeat domain-containing protein [Planctomycetota bacterium]